MRSPLWLPLTLLSAALVALAACAAESASGASPADPSGGPSSGAGEPEGAASQPAQRPEREGFATLPQVPPGAQVATFAGGCFWCMESSFEPVDGILSVTSGYTGGHVDRPTYEQVSSRTTGHAEAIYVVFDPKRLSYEKLLEHFWVNVDPTTDDRQFCDSGDEYRPEIFVHDAAQRKAAEASRRHVVETFSGPVKVKITDATVFYPAETYHQDFYKKNPGRYLSYRYGCGRDARLKQLWGDKAGGGVKH